MPALVALVLSSLAGAVLLKLKQRLGIEADSQSSRLVDEAMDRAIAFGINQVRDRVGGGQLSYDVKSEVLAEGLQYLLHQAPGAVRQLSDRTDSGILRRRTLVVRSGFHAWIGCCMANRRTEEVGAKPWQKHIR